MDLFQSGKHISRNEITNIEPFGFWLLADGQEYFVPFDDYPVFKNATVQQMFNMVTIGPGQFHWPDLDADVELEALQYPDHFPLSYQIESK